MTDFKAPRRAVVGHYMSSGYRGFLSTAYLLACGHYVSLRYLKFGKHPKTKQCLECMRKRK